MGWTRGAEWCCDWLQGLISIIIIIIIIFIYDDAGVLHDNAKQAFVPVGLAVRWQQQAHHHQRPHAPHHLHHQVSHQHHHHTYFSTPMSDSDIYILMNISLALGPCLAGTLRFTSWAVFTWISHSGTSGWSFTMAMIHRKCPFTHTYSFKLFSSKKLNMRPFPHTFSIYSEYLFDSQLIGWVSLW